MTSAFVKNMSKPLLALGAVLVGVWFPASGVLAQSDAEIRKMMIRESIRYYSGSCPCPYNTDRAGRRCGGRSAYSRPGGASPLCYDSDIGAGQVVAYRERHGFGGGVPVQELQLLLQQRGFDPGPIDGVFGERTAGAISAAEAELGLPVTGRPSSELLEALR